MSTINPYTSYSNGYTYFLYNSDSPGYGIFQVSPNYTSKLFVYYLAIGGGASGANISMTGGGGGGGGQFSYGILELNGGDMLTLSQGLGGAGNNSSGSNGTATTISYTPYNGTSSIIVQANGGLAPPSGNPLGTGLGGSGGFVVNTKPVIKSVIVNGGNGGTGNSDISYNGVAPTSPVFFYDNNTSYSTLISGGGGAGLGPLISPGVFSVGQGINGGGNGGGNTGNAFNARPNSGGGGGGVAAYFTSGSGSSGVILLYMYTNDLIINQNTDINGYVNVNGELYVKQYIETSQAQITNATINTLTTTNVIKFSPSPGIMPVCLCKGTFVWNGTAYNGYNMYNVQGAFLNGSPNGVKIQFITPVPNANYQVIATCSGQGGILAPQCWGKTTTYFNIITFVTQTVTTTYGNFDVIVWL
jgi:hypothetical protein